MLPDRHLLESTLGAGALSERPHLFSESVIELPGSELAVLANFVKAVTTLMALPGFQKAIAERQGGNLSQQTPGVCLGFDFH